MKARASLSAALMAGVVLLSGCSTAISGSPRAAGPAPTSASASASASMSTSPPETPTEESESAVTSEVEPLIPVPPMTVPTDSPTTELSGGPGDGGSVDGESMAWLSSFCNGVSDVLQYASPATDGMTIDAALQTIVDAYYGMSQAASETAAALGEMPEPTFAGADAMVPAIQNWLFAVYAVYGDGADTIASTTFESEDDITSTIDAIEAGMDDPNTELGAALSQIDPAAQLAIADLPECAVITE